MVIVMEHAASEEQVQRVIESLVEVGYDVHRSSGVDFTVLGAVGVPHRPIDPRLIEVLPGVREVIRVSEPYKLAGRTFKAEDTVVDVAGVKVGASEVIAMAGPCSVESAEQVASALCERARQLYGLATAPGSLEGLFDVLERDFGTRGTHVWLLDDLTYLAARPHASDEAALLVYGLRDLARSCSKNCKLLKAGDLTRIQGWLSWASSCRIGLPKTLIHKDLTQERPAKNAQNSQFSAQSHLPLARSGPRSGAQGPIGPARRAS